MLTAFFRNGVDEGKYSAVILNRHLWIAIIRF
jgi:hypothetical protein